MSLDPATAEFIARADAAGLRGYHQYDDVDEARAVFAKLAAARRGDGPPPGPEVSVEQVSRGDQWCRIYRPMTGSAFEAPMPLVLFIHGGGWVIGDLDTHDAQARAFAAMPAVVVSIEYRLAPEHPFPAAHDDCWDWLLWAVEGMGDWSHTDRLVVAGDSAGGLLAASMAQRCRDIEDAPELAAQCLIYPAMDPAMDRPSHAENAEGYLLTTEMMRWFYEQYAPGEGFSPLELDDLSGLAPAVVATAEYDPLADDGLRYAHLLREAGVTTTNLHFGGLIHGFFGMGGVSAASQSAVDATVAAVRALID